MSIALDSSSNRIEGSGYIHGLSRMIFESPDKTRKIAAIDQRFSMAAAAKSMKKKAAADVDDDDRSDLENSSSSSIGRNSDDSESDREEVQSSYKGPLDSLNALEEVLPIRRGISKFYSGKSKSFTSLADASSSSIKEIVKPDNAYTRKRKNLIAASIILDKDQNNPLRGVSKSSRRRTFGLSGTPSSSSESITSETSNASSSSPPPTRLPPLHPQLKPSVNSACSSQPNFASRRAFSLMDLQIANDNHSSISNRDENREENKKQH